MESVFSDDFRQDTRYGDEIEGKVAWGSGTLTLTHGERGSIKPAINGGRWAVVSGPAILKPDRKSGRQIATARLQATGFEVLI